MKYNPEKHHRRSIRLKGYDYSTAGAYFITICTNNREIFLVKDDIKEMIHSIWQKLPVKFRNVSVDKFVIMPNYIHGIIFLNDTDSNSEMKRMNANTPKDKVFVGADPRVCPQKEKDGEHMGSPLPMIGHIVQWFKTMTTNEYIKGAKKKGWKSFDKRFWQRNYYEHIIRNEEDLNQIREYIINNQLNWESDDENPKNWRANPWQEKQCHNIINMMAVHEPHLQS